MGSHKEPEGGGGGGGQARGSGPPAPREPQPAPGTRVWEADLATAWRGNTGHPPPLQLLRNPKGGSPGPGQHDSVTVDFAALGVQTRPAGRVAKAPAAFSSSVKWGLASFMG